MRRSLAAVLVALGTGLAVLPAPTTSAAAAEPASPVAPATSAASATEPVTPTAARRALGQLTDVLTERRQAPVDDGAETTLLLRDLFVSLPALAGSDRRQAEALLARPTDGAQDRYGDGYTVGSRKRCSTHVCVHYVPRTADRPTSTAWVAENLSVLERVWRKEVTAMGYRAPVADGRRGGNAKFDVYLKDLGRKGLYGYCAPEYVKRDQRRVASGYCVLDNDFARAQYGASPLRSLVVTAAHEFFHAVQFAYDYREDLWLMESTATWMEERVADEADDNRQYLRAGQLSLPARSLDRFDPDGFAQYGNWTFWEYLGGRFGNGIVKAVWNKAGAFKGAPDLYSAQALRRAVGGRGGGLAAVFASYAAANTAPGRYYREGSAWPTAGHSRRLTLTEARRGSSATVRINHLASRSVAVRPSGLDGRRWRLRLTVDAPDRASSPAVHVLVRKKRGAWTRRSVPLTAKGRGRLVVPFSAAKVSAVTVTLANASTRYRCHRGTTLSCRGKAVDQGKPFRVQVKAVER